MSSVVQIIRKSAVEMLQELTVANCTDQSKQICLQKSCSFVYNFLIFSAVKKLQKSVKIHQVKANKIKHVFKGTMQFSLNMDL